MNGVQSGAVFSSQTATGPSTNVVRFPASAERVLITEEVHQWRDEVLARLTELVRLPDGWDGYRGAPVSIANAYFALRMLEMVCGTNTKPPQIVPGGAGDLQIEWHTANGDIELHVRGPNNVNAWSIRTGVLPDERELELTNDFTDVAKWVKEIVETDA